ncbi:nitrilase-related carbon-nitrogen hydrolase [Roseovarius dicentrarchi]|uniref:nitrilase-related carbon-nitrogen hydrolase n=1 Tax=Roseovarius dicentrarchi TaxID=2250573 RepID=UPI001939A47C|nr:nitrilase-related carbon-nitrogen hydrolase [Roseovarius dicentrarchi]
MLKIAVWQTTPHHDPHQALAALKDAARRARANGADLIITPEMALGGYNIGPAQCRALAASADALVEGMKSIAIDHDIAIIAGLALPGPGAPYNAAIALDAAGAELGRYHKTHLYGDVDRSQFSPGAALPAVFTLNGWTVGLAICYDIEFPEVARALALQGADMILVPTANMSPFDSVATRLVPARAEENAVFVAYANYTGVEGAFDYGGLSCICGPDGNDLARAAQGAPDLEPELIFADLSRGALAACRTRQTHLNDRRPALYGGPNAKGMLDE